jgi:hypothetical protein
LKKATGFDDDGDVREYFLKKAKGVVKEDKIKESLTQDEWIWLIGLDKLVNPYSYQRLIANDDGSLRLVLEHEIYEDGAWIAKDIVGKLYGPETKVDIKDVACEE